MNTAKLNDWLTVITNIGVIAGLVLLAYEVSQTNQALNQEARALTLVQQGNASARYGNIKSWIIQNEDVADIWVRGNASLESLDSAERERYRLIAESLFFGGASDWVAAGGPTDPEGTVVGARLIHAGYLRGNPGLRALFDEWVDRYGTTGFARSVVAVEAMGGVPISPQ